MSPEAAPRAAAADAPVRRPEAAAVVWDWKRTAGGPSSASSDGEQRRRLRRRALVEALVAGAAGGVLFLWRPPVAWVAWAIGAVVLAAALASPTGLYAGLRRALAGFGHAVGLVLTVVFLVPLYYGFFTVFGLLFRRGRRDRMERRFDRAAPSYWKRRPERERALTDYERLF